MSTYCMKIAVLGDQAVGKTCAVKAFSGLSFEQVYHETRDIKIWDTILPSPGDDINDSKHDDGDEPGSRIRAQFWDCGASHLDESRMSRMLDGALCAMILYDITDYGTYMSAISKWHKSVLSLAPDTFIVLIGCKMDQGKCRAVELKQVEEFCAENSLFFMEMSAQMHMNVDLTLSILRIRAKHTMNASVHASVVHMEEEDKQRYQAVVDWSEAADGSEELTTSIPHRKVPVASISLKEEQEELKEEGNRILSQKNSINGEWTNPNHPRLSESPIARSLPPKPVRPPVVYDDASGSAYKSTVSDELDNMTISSLLGRTNRCDSGSVYSVENQRDLDESIRNIVEDIKTLDRKAAAASSHLKHINAVASPVHRFKSVQDDRVVSKGSSVKQLETQKEYEHLTQIIKDALEDEGDDRSQASSSCYSKSQSSCSRSQNSCSRSQSSRKEEDDFGFGKMSTPTISPRASPSSLSVGQNIVVPSGGQVRLHRTGSVTVKGAPLDNTDTYSTYSSGSGGSSKASLQLRWQNGKGGNSTRSRRKSITPEEMTLHNRPTKSYIRKLEEEAGEQPKSELAKQEDELMRLNENLRRAKSSRTAPDLYVDVNMAGNLVGTIPVREGANPGVLASEFVRKHNLDATMTEKLVRILKQRVSDFYRTELGKMQASASDQTRKNVKLLRSSDSVTRGKAPRLNRKRRSQLDLTWKDRPIIGTLNVKVAKGRVGKLVVREGDDPRELVANFAKTFGLRSRQATQIEERIVMQLEYEQNRKLEEEKSVERKEESHGHVPMVNPSKPPSPIRYPSILTSNQRELLQATLGGEQRLKTPPPPPRSPPSVPKRELFNLDVNIGQGRMERIVVCEDDDLVLLAENFCRKHGLALSKVPRVQFLLEEKTMLHTA